MPLILGFLTMHIKDLFVQITFSVQKNPTSTENFGWLRPQTLGNNFLGDVVAEIAEQGGSEVMSLWSS